MTDANDDAGNARPAFLASKNVFLPNKTAIESLELYISRSLWGGMQMTDKEKYPYAIYGIPNFRANRESADAGRNGQSHVWRIYDYPHIVMLYHRMYQIARLYPDKVTQLDAATYLERAFRTAVAYWTVPMAVEKWSADAVGTMNEQRLHLLLDHDGFAKEQPVTVADDLSRVQFVVENRSGGAHTTSLSVAGLPAGDYVVTVDGRDITTVPGGRAAPTLVALPVGAGSGIRVVLARTHTQAKLRRYL